MSQRIGLSAIRSATTTLRCITSLPMKSCSWRRLFPSAKGVRYWEFVIGLLVWKGEVELFLLSQWAELAGEQQCCCRVPCHYAKWASPELDSFHVLSKSHAHELHFFFEKSYCVVRCILFSFFSLQFCTFMKVLKIFHVYTLLSFGHKHQTSWNIVRLKHSITP